METLATKFEDVRAVLADAENRQLREDEVKCWMSKLKDISYDMDNVLYEWSTAIGKSLIMGHVEEPPHQNSNKKKKVMHFLTCFSCFPRCREVGLRHHIAVKIEDLNERFDDILNQKRLLNFNFHQMETTTQQQVFEPPRTTTSLLDVEAVKGREEEKEVIINKLLNESSQTPKLHIISITGMGGIEKITLALLVYNDSVVSAGLQQK